LGRSSISSHWSAMALGLVMTSSLAKRRVEVVEFPEHLVGGAEKYGAAAVGVVELLGGLEHPAVFLVLGVQKMHVAGGYDRLAQPLSGGDYAAVIVLQHGLVLDGAVIHQKAVVAQGLDLKIVVKRGDLVYLLVALAAHHRAVKLAHAAGGADDYALPVLYQQALGYSRRLVKIVQIRLGHHLVEIFKAGAVFHQQNHVSGAGHVGALEAVIHRLYIVHRARALGAEHGQEFVHDAGHHHGVVRGAVVVELGELQMVGHDVQLKALKLRQQRLGQRQSVQIYRREFEP
jgi:hypothetical protein